MEGAQRKEVRKRVRLFNLGSFSLIGHLVCKHVTTSPQHVSPFSHQLINCHTIPLFRPIEFSLGPCERVLGLPQPIGVLGYITPKRRRNNGC